MFLHTFEGLCRVDESLEVKLPQKGLKLDTRVNDPNYIQFDIRYHKDGITADLTRLRNHYCGVCDGIERPFTMRVFDPEMEALPDFNSTIYISYGLKGERVPYDATEVIIHPSAMIIRKNAFSCCTKLRRVVLHENVKTIENCAFLGCVSLYAIFLPSSLKRIGKHAFDSCSKMRILSIPPSISISQIGYGIIYACDTFFHITQIQRYGPGRTSCSNKVNQAIVDFHLDLPPLHKTCLASNVSAQSIRQCITTHGIAASGAFQTAYGGMLPMHILALNPHADSMAMIACLETNMGAIFERYSEGQDENSLMSGKTPLDLLGEYSAKSHLSVVAALCAHKEAH